MESALTPRSALASRLGRFDKIARSHECLCCVVCLDATLEYVGLL